MHFTKTLVVSLLSALFILPGAFAQKNNQTWDFAKARFERVTEVDYTFFLDLGSDDKIYAGKAQIRFNLNHADQPLVVDFTGQDVREVKIDEQAVPFTYDAESGALTIAASGLKRGKQVMDIDFVGLYSSTGVGLHRFVDPADGLIYLFTDFEPRDAHRAIPCFDQPDIKASFQLQTKTPTDWTVITNTPLLHERIEEGRRVSEFKRSKRFSTYLFHISAGHYASWHDPNFRYPLGIYCRQSMAHYLTGEAEHMLASTRKGFDFLDDYFGRPYQFEKYDQLFVPEFNSGAMENVGAVTWTESMIPRRRPTASFIGTRDMILMHEMAHQWFGNLTTMKWWNDLWLNESFATYMGYMGSEALGNKNVWESARDRGQRAKREDQLPTTHPVLAEVPDTHTASLIFDNITYGKGFSVLRQLDTHLGGTVFRDALRLYFEENAWGNTTLDDFMSAMERASGKELNDWTHLWLGTTGINTIRLSVTQKDGKIQSAELEQLPSKDNGVLRPHTTDFALYYADEGGKPELGEKLLLSYSGKGRELDELVGKDAPVMIMPNVTARDYVKVTLDDHSLSWLLGHLDRLPDNQIKKTSLVVLWDMMQDNQLKPKRLLDALLTAAENESDPTALDDWLDAADNIVSDYVPDDATRKKVGELGFRLAKKKVTEQPESDVQRGWYDALVEFAYYAGEYDYLEELFDGKTKIEGLEVDTGRKWTILVKLTAAGRPGRDVRLSQLREEDKSSRATFYQRMIDSLEPTAEAKGNAWELLVHNKDNLSNRELFALASGFYSFRQPSLAADYGTKYFDVLPELYQQQEWTIVERFVDMLYPSLGGEKTLTLARAFLARKDIPKPLYNLVLSNTVNLERTLKLRQSFN